MTSIHLTLADTAVLVGYLIVVLAIGFIASRQIKSADHFFLGGRKFSKWIMIGQSFGTGTHAEMPVSLAGAVYNIGLSGIWFQWKNLFVTPFYWLLAPLFRRFRRTTMSEVFDDRYGPWMGAIYTVFALLFFTINLASMLKGAAKVIDQALGGGLPVDLIVIGMTCVFVIYSFAGGLLATAWSDFIQGFLIIALSFMLIPLGWHYVGGMDGMKATLGAQKFLLATPDGIGLWTIVVLTINGLVGIVAQPHLIASVGTGRDENACRVGHFYGNLVKRVCTIGWAIVGLMTAAIIARGVFGDTSLRDPEEAFGYACRHLLFPGGIGLLIAALLAANMAGCSAFMINSGALLTNGIYRKYVNRSASDQRCLLIGRLGGVLVVACAVLYSVFLIKRVLYSFLLTETMATFVGVGVLGGIMWPRANRWGAVASIAAAMIANFSGYALTGRRFDHWDPTIFLSALGVGIIALVVVSLLTPPEDEKRTAAFFNRLQTPSDSDADDQNSGALQTETVRRKHAMNGRLLLLVNLLSLRRSACGVPLLRAYRTDLKGFVIGSALIGALILAFALAIRA
ncbi:MAG: sodium:solute symporter family protein [Opitutaceae bacterium]|nr:sodium:solute symporter family protein [Opitutaceae bacterium]